jgi:prepilin peptidase CpaA
MIGAAAGDALTYRIPNWLCLTIAGLFFPFALMAGLPLATIGWHLLAGFGVLAIGFGIFAAGWFGGGDAKLLGAAALWFGWPDSLRFVVYAVLAGGVLALVVFCWSVLRTDRELRGGARFKKLLQLKPNVPYGVALAAGALFTLPGTWLTHSVG